MMERGTLFVAGRSKVILYRLVGRDGSRAFGILQTCTLLSRTMLSGRQASYRRSVILEWDVVGWADA